MEFGLEADGRAGWARGDDGGSDGGCWSSRRWCLRRGTVLRLALKRQRSGYVSSFFFSLLSSYVSLYDRISIFAHSLFTYFSQFAVSFHIDGSKNSHFRKEILK